jgi:GDP-4-dehydro-6-deoxy-D-mannose reductase
VPRLVEAGHDVTAAVRRGLTFRPDGVPVRELELVDEQSVRETVRGAFDAVAHLAAVASGGDARGDPRGAWNVNASGTGRLAETLATGRDAMPVLLVASTAEVYGPSKGEALRTEADPPAPCSPYGESKLGAESAALDVARRSALRVVIARAFPHTGAGQDTRFVVPAFARRLWDAKRAGDREVAVGNLDPVRDFLHVDDVVDAYVLLLERGRSGAVYNIASGVGVSIGDVFARLCALIGAQVRAVPDPALVRKEDIAHLVGDATRLRRETGWAPKRSLDEALAEVASAEAH